MDDVSTRLDALRRPRLLIRAARHALRDYDRGKLLRRLLATDRPPAPDRALDRLMDQEDALESARREGDAAYSVSRHIEVLVALIGEARLRRQGAA
ncbi:hypothetical protein BV394_01800 [Brevirhabdus pacifica]|uniref:Uncharacterized protein n=1 Tax=Brevirhabdus pacifica TaxID=1267768 RepID=A0A1U7DLM8_9RHOB|nr:DUF6477 family protein [Brevirhabdus pacifica]APX90906.1 hypothetical protein BV394_01800 [Brevirhabdus pacifica]OWU80346.1 hypothetical protein ATO5_02495 [Loktanella sp. 22II-4b]PJJ86889.1 hypothetical protein CLV77_1450 [Brevirhabdus pacifica]